MFPSSELNPLIDFVVYRLRTAEWISGYQFQKDRGYLLEWTAKGRQRALLLQKLIIRHELTDQSNVRKFSTICLEEASAPSDDPVPAVERDFWRICLEELGIGLEENSLAALARVIASWEPS